MLGRGVDRFPNICDAPLRYERWMSLLGEGDRGFCCPVAAAKNGDVLDSELSAGDSIGKAGESIGGLLDGFEAPSARIHGPDERFSETADSTGEVVLGGSVLGCSC